MLTEGVAGSVMLNCDANRMADARALATDEASTEGGTVWWDNDVCKHT